MSLWSDFPISSDRGALFHANTARARDSHCGCIIRAVATFDAIVGDFSVSQSNLRIMARRRKFDFEFKEKVLQYAEQNSGEKTARHFNIDTKRIRYWRKQKEELLSADRGRARLTGGGRKKVSAELERKLSEWMRDRRDIQVSRNMIKKKALEIYASVSDGGKTFVASAGWLQRFLQRNDPSLRRPVATAAARTDAGPLADRLVSFVEFVGRTVGSRAILEEDIMAMDETVVGFDVMYPGDPPATRTGPPKPAHLTVVLAAKADGTKLKPYIVFREAVDEVLAMQRTVSGAVIATSSNGWMNDTLTADWLRTVVGRVSSSPRLLAWDSYRCHISDATEAELRRGYDITTAVIPRGCAKHLQAADVVWNRPFKQNLQDAYDQWLDGDVDKEYAAGGYLKVPAHRLLVDWIVSAWDKLDTDLIRMSFKVCGLSVSPDGSEDDLILYFREGQPGAARRDALTRVRLRRQEDMSRTYEDDKDNKHVVVDDEEEGGENSGSDDCW